MQSETNKLTYMKRFLLMAMAVICGFAGVAKMSAANELYAVLSSDKKTVMFWYDGQRSSRGGSTNWQNDIYAGNESKITTVTITSSVKDARPTTGYHFFYNLYSLTTINNMSNLITGEMTNMEGMFYNCASLTSINLSTSFGTSKVTTMRNMFNNCRKLESLDFSIFHTSNVKDMRGMFYDCWALKTIKFGYYFETDYVTDMSYMFYACKALTTITGDRTTLSTTRATDLSSMFYGCSVFDMSDMVKNLSTSNVTTMSRMFMNCKAVKSLNLRKWDIGKVTNVSEMFSGCTSLTTIYRNDNWKKLNIASSGSMFSGCTSLKGGKGTSYNSSKTGLEMAHPDNSGVGGYFTGEETSYDQLYGVVVGTTFNIRYDKECTLRTGLTTITDLSADEAETITTVKIESAVKNAKITSTKMWFCSMPNLTTVEGLENINWSNVTDVSYMFADDVKLPSMDLRKMNLTGKKCDYMFQNCSALKTIYCDNDYTTTLSSGTQMFYGCSSLQGQRGTTYTYSHADASYARPDGGTVAPGYFTGVLKELYSTCDPDTTVMLIHYDEHCDLNKGDIYWYTSNAGKYRTKVTQVIFDMSMDNYHPTSMTRWFSDFKQLKELSGMMYLHTDQVTDMTETFANCESLQKLDVSRFQTNKVKSMDATFMGCKALKEIDVNNFFDFDDVSANAIERTTRMFAFCDKLQTIYCNNDWTTLGVTYSNNMFIDSKALRCGNDTKYDPEHIDISYARPGRGVTQRGYFTQKKTDIGQVGSDKQATISGKYILNGQLLIERDGKVYNVIGARVR